MIVADRLGRPHRADAEHGAGSAQNRLDISGTASVGNSGRPLDAQAPNRLELVRLPPTESMALLHRAITPRPGKDHAAIFPRPATTRSEIDRHTVAEQAVMQFDVCQLRIDRDIEDNFAVDRVPGLIDVKNELLSSR